jgi:pimeloyl-ACP methyl ester carboxylesterase
MRNSRRESPGLGWITLTDYRKAGLRRAWATVRLALEDRIEDKLPGIVAPTLVVRGEHDPIVPQPWAEQVTRLLPKGGAAGPARARTHRELHGAQGIRGRGAAFPGSVTR